jgi:hypothetical protein
LKDKRIMRVWTIQPKAMAPIINDPTRQVRVRPTLDRAGRLIYTVVALQTSNGHPVHTAIAVFTDEGEAARFAAVGGSKPQQKRAPKPAQFTNTLRVAA